jgi:hypothetical protein
MGTGGLPFGIDLDPRDPIDEGTAALIPAPPPGPVGLDAKNGTAKPTPAGMSDSVVGYARSHDGGRVGNGECFALADEALRAAGAKSAADFGRVTSHADYVWGTSVGLADVQPGDVIQFRNYTYHRVDVVKDDRATTTEERDEGRPHHTAIVESVDGDGALTVWEQNAPAGGPVTRTQLFFSDRNETSGKRTTKITVRGRFRFYRPEAN